MAIITLTTAAGAPGASTTGLGLALAWGGPTVLVEADPAGSSVVSGWYRCGIDPAPRNLVNLALTDHSDDLAEAVLNQCVTIDTTPPSEFERLLLIGLSEPAQAPALQPWWEPIGHALRALSDAGYTVIVDAGRLTQGSYPMPLLFEADQVLLVCRGTLSSIVRSAAMTSQLRHILDRVGAGDRLGLAVIGNTGRLYYSAAEAAKDLHVPFALTIPDDPDAAAVLSDGLPRRRGLVSHLRLRTRRETAPIPTGDTEEDPDPRAAALKGYAVNGNAPQRPDNDVDNDLPAEEPTTAAASPLLRAYRVAASDINKRIETRTRRFRPPPIPTGETA